MEDVSKQSAQQDAVDVKMKTLIELTRKQKKLHLRLDDLILQPLDMKS